MVLSRSSLKRKCETLTLTACYSNYSLESRRYKTEGHPTDDPTLFLLCFREKSFQRETQKQKKEGALVLLKLGIIPTYCSSCVTGVARSGVGSWRRRSTDQFDGSHWSPCGSEEVYVLAVDDSLVDQKVIERLFKIFSRKVTAVDSGTRALQFLGLDEEKTAGNLNGSKVDLIITDYRMPGMTGYELLKKIKESSALRDIPVVIMSSENVLARIDRCKEEGAEDFIGKPVKLSDVKRLKDFTTRDVVDRVRIDGGGTTQKRTLQESFDVSSSSSSVSSAPSSSSGPTTPSRSTSPSVSSSKPILEESHRHLNCGKRSIGDSEYFRILVCPRDMCYPTT